MSAPDNQPSDVASPMVYGPTEYDDPPAEEIIDTNTARDDNNAKESDSSPKARPGEPRLKSHLHERGNTPAYVSPIPKIDRISPVPEGGSAWTTRADKDTISSAGRPTIPRFLLARLVGHKVDEYGDVVDDNGRVLGQAEGDLPAMMGHTVANNNGDILDAEGDLIGYVVHVMTEQEKRDLERRNYEKREKAVNPTETQTLDEFTQGDSNSFRVDTKGNILDRNGNIVGKLHDNKKSKLDVYENLDSSEDSTNSKSNSESSANNVGSPPKQNAETFRKEGESPSDIFLDVKSTTEGIQLVIRIPTVFNGGGPPTKVQIS